jgi:hypothetical protein
VVAKFQLQLAELLAVVESSETHFVRCVKPNMHKSAASYLAHVTWLSPLPGALRQAEHAQERR